jgi:hypothetical protein
MNNRRMLLMLSPYLKTKETELLLKELQKRYGLKRMNIIDEFAKYFPYDESKTYDFHYRLKCFLQAFLRNNRDHDIILESPFSLIEKADHNAIKTKRPVKPFFTKEHLKIMKEFFDLYAIIVMAGYHNLDEEKEKMPYEKFRYIKESEFMGWAKLDIEQERKIQLLPRHEISFCLYLLTSFIQKPYMSF